MTTETIKVQTFDPIPPIMMERRSPANPLKGLMITVFSVKIVVAAFLLATVSLAPPVSADTYDVAVAAVD